MGRSLCSRIRWEVRKRIGCGDGQRQRQKETETENSCVQTETRAGANAVNWTSAVLVGNPLTSQMGGNHDLCSAHG